MSTSHKTFLCSSLAFGAMLVAFGTTAACDDDVSADDVVDDAGGSSSGGSSSGGLNGTAIPVPTGATLNWQSKGGFGPGPSDASTCTPSDDTYVYDLPSKLLTWKVCRPIPSVPEDPAYAFEQGTKTLSVEEDATIHAALEQVTFNTTVLCGADAPTITLQVIAPNDATTTYVDQFYHCEDDGKNYVDGLGELGGAFLATIAVDEE